MYPALIVLAGLLFFAPALISRRLTLPIDILGYWYPWNVESDAFDGALPQNPLIQDLLTLMTAWYSFAWHELRAGRLPLWNPWQVGGMPFLANDESAVLFPIQWLALLLPLSEGLQFVMVAETLGVGLGMYAFLRAIGLGRPAACVGGAGLMLSGFFVLWLDYPLVAVGMWLPWCLLCCERLLQGRRWRLWTAGLALATGLHLVAGHIQTSAHVMMACAVYSLCRALGQYFTGAGGGLNARVVLGRVLPIALGVVLGVGLAAAQLGPLVQYLQSSYTQFYRASVAVEPAQPLSNLASWLVPNISGNPSFNALVPAQQSLNGAYFNFNERTAYVGIAMLILVALVPGHRRRRFRHYTWVFLLLLIFAGGLAYGIGPIYSIAVTLPGLHELNNNRLIFVMAFALVALGAMGFDSLGHGALPEAGRRSSAVRWIPNFIGYAGVLAAGALVAAAVLLSKEQIVNVVASIGGDVGGPTIVAWTRAWTAWALALLMVSAALIGATRARRIPPNPGRIAVALVLVADLLLIGDRSYPQARPEQLFPDVALTQFLRSLGPDARFVAGQGDWRQTPPTFMPNVSTGYELRDMNVYEALVAYRAHVFMDTLNRNGPNYDLPTVLVANYAPDYRLLALAGVTNVLLPTEDAEPAGANAHLVFQRESGPLDQPLEPLEAGRVQTQSFVASSDDLAAVGVFIARDVGVGGVLDLTLTDAESGAVARGAVDLTHRPDAAWVVVSFPPVAASAGRTYTASITLEGVTGRGAIRLFGNPAATLERAQRSVSGAIVPGVLRFRLFRSTASAWVHPVWNDASHTLYALDSVRPRAYVATNVVQAADQNSALSSLDALAVPGSDAVVESSSQVSSAGGTASILWDHPGDVAIQATVPAPSVLVLEEGYGDGGWNVDVDGTSGSVLRANYLFQGAVIPAGTHMAHFRYWPRSLTIGISISVLALLAIIGLGFGAASLRRMSRSAASLLQTKGVVQRNRYGHTTWK